VLLLLIGASLLLLRAINRRLAPRRARSILQSAKDRERPVGIGWRIIRGRIVEGWAETPVGREWRRARRSDRLVVESEGERVVVAGNVRVVLGAAGRDDAEARAVMRVAETDEVYVAGTLRRTDDGTWEVAASASSLDRFVELTASAPAPVGGRMSTAGAVCWAILLAVGWYMGLRAVGQHALAEARRASGPFSEVASLDALAIAAAVPVSHGDALDLLESRLERQFERTEEALELWIELVERHGCAYRKMTELRRYEEGLAAARRCGTRQDEAAALALLGRYEEAAAIADDGSDVALVSRMALGRWLEAARGIERGSTRSCFSAYLRVLGGEPAAFDSAPRGDSVCDLLKAVLRPRDEAVRLLDGAAVEEHTRASILRYDLLAALGHGRAGGSYSALSTFADRTVWFSDARLGHAEEIDPRDFRPMVLQNAYMGRVLRDLYRGDFSAARSNLSIGLGVHLYSPIMHEDMVLLDPSTPPLLPFFWEPGSMYRVRDLDYANTAILCEGHSAERAFLDAARGDGTKLAALARACKFYASAVLELVSVGRGVVTARTEIAAALRLQQMASISGGSVGEIPFQLVHDLMLNREVARAFGDDEQVRRLQVIIDRHVAVLDDPNRALPLLVLDALP
jgi:hypothetical protein